MKTRVLTQIAFALSLLGMTTCAKLPPLTDAQKDEFLTTLNDATLGQSVYLTVSGPGSFDPTGDSSEDPEKTKLPLSKLNFKTRTTPPKGVTPIQMMRDILVEDADSVEANNYSLLYMLCNYKSKDSTPDENESKTTITISGSDCPVDFSLEIITKTGGATPGKSEFIYKNKFLKDGSFYEGSEINSIELEGTSRLTTSGESTTWRISWDGIAISKEHGEIPVTGDAVVKAKGGKLESETLFRFEFPKYSGELLMLAEQAEENDSENVKIEYFLNDESMKESTLRKKTSTYLGLGELEE